MKRIVRDSLLLCLIGTGAALAQQPAPPPPPPVPAPPAVRPGDPMRPGGPNMGMRPGARPEGMQGWNTFQMGTPDGARYANRRMAMIRSRQQELEITPAQMERINALWIRSQTDQQARNQDLRERNEALQKLMDADNPDLVAIEAQLRTLERVRTDNTMASLRLDQQVMQILTPAQREKLKTLSPVPRGGFGGRMGGPNAGPMPPMPPGAPMPPDGPRPPMPPGPPGPPAPPAP